MTPAAMRAGPSTLVLELSLAGRIVYLCDTEGFTLTRRTPGESDVTYLPGLTVSGVSRVLSWFAGDMSPRSVACEVQIPDDVAELLAAGSTLDGDSAELAEAWPSADYEDRRVLLVGRVVEPLVGAQGEAIAFSVTEDPGDDRGSLPPATATVSDSTFPREDGDPRLPSVPYSGTVTIGFDSRIAGAGWPIVLGAPGASSATASGLYYQGAVPATPALVIERDNDGSASSTYTNYAILVAWGAVEAAAVRVWNLTDSTRSDASATVLLGRDKLGQSFSYIEAEGIGLIPEDGDEIWVSWDDSAGGLTDPYADGALRRADHVIRWALAQSTLRIDPDAGGQLAGLAGYAFDGYLNDPMSPWEWLRTVVLPLLPAAVVCGPEGLSVLAWQAEPTEHDVVCELVEDENAERVTPLAEVGRDSLVNRVTVRFAPHAQQGSSTLSITVTGDRTIEEQTDPSVIPSPWARRSQRRYGTLTKEITTPIVYDPATATAIALWQVQAFALPVTTVAYRLDRTFGWLRPGHVVALTSDGLHLDAQLAHVEVVVPEADGSSTVGFRWWAPAAFPAS